MKKLQGNEMKRLSTEEYKNTKKLPVVVVLDDVRSMNNIGSIFRTCDAFMIEKIFLCGITGTPPHRDIQKTALGATESVDWTYCRNIHETLAELRKNGYKILAAEQADGSTQLHEFNPLSSDKYAIVFGNEVDGVQQAVLDQADRCIEIPQFGTKHSLNIAVCAGIILWETSNKMMLQRK
jgi:tRNA G18 (ribose-2'-O)-methylase SpoU